MAFVNRRDRYHAWTLDQWSRLVAPLLTCEAVLSEACFLLRRDARGPSAILELVNRRVLIVPFQVEAEVTAVARLVAQYRQAPMSLADACLVRMSEQYTDSILVTFDRQFRVYRRHRREVIPTLMPPARPGRRR